MLRYWWRVTRRAFTDTLSFLGHNRKSAMTGFVGIVLTFGIYGMLEGEAQVMSKVWWWIAGIGGSAVLFLACLLWKLLATPPLLEKEAKDEADGREKEIKTAAEAREHILTDQGNQLRTEKSELEKRIEKAERKHRQKVAELEAELLRKIEELKNPQHTESELLGLIDRGTKLMLEESGPKGRSHPEVETERYRWFTEVQDLLKLRWPDQVEQLKPLERDTVGVLVVLKTILGKLP